MQDLSAAHRSNISRSERKKSNRPAFGGHKLDLERCPITIAMHYKLSAISGQHSAFG
jgi:hypothetical protein